MQRQLGSALFDALRQAGDRPSEFTVPIGAMEIHTKVALAELTQLDGARPAIIDVMVFISMMLDH